MQQTLSKVKSLEKFLEKHGEDALIFNTISKMLDYKIREYAGKIKRLDKDLKKFEHTYKKTSKDFAVEFKKGRLGDSMDFIEWSSLYKMRNNLIEKKAQLEGRKIDA